MADRQTRLEIPQILRATPSVIRTLVKGFTDETLQWRPNPERWSAAMMVTHLAESEVVCFRTRLMRIANGRSPLLESYDQWEFLRTLASYPVEAA